MVKEHKSLADPNTPQSFEQELNEKVSKIVNEKFASANQL